MIDEKANLRRSLLKVRRALSTQAWDAKSDRLCHHLEHSTLFQNAKTVLAYVSFRQEPNLHFLWQRSLKRWGLPRCVGQSLDWHHWQPGEGLESGAFGILEPRASAPVLTPATVDLVLVPAVACDRRGYRLGYGGGFYDRMLSLPEWRSVPTLGIVFEFAYVAELPTEPWDQPMTGICTEEQFVWI
ncbi:MAG: 5-formyltetrahydrofolate cyclo-ligase [Microcoleaceae cyanobacterium]